jgi:hypothetical protein
MNPPTAAESGNQNGDPCREGVLRVSKILLCKIHLRLLLLLILQQMLVVRRAKEGKMIRYVREL